MTKQRLIALAITISTMLTGPGSAETIYGEDLAWQLANPKEIRRITKIRARLSKETKTAIPLFVLTPPPFEEIEAAPNELSNTVITAKSWDLPPWPVLDPALPDDMSAEERSLLEHRRNNQSGSDVWSELSPVGGIEDAPSVLLRPRNTTLNQKLVYRIKEIPDPFSLRRYYDREDIFVEVAAYGGTTSFKAEEAFRALKEAATRQTLLQGIGKEAFLTRIEIREDDDPEGLPFSDLEPAGEERPELMDSGKATAMQAPAFQDVAVKDLEGRTIVYVEPSKRNRSNEPEVIQSLIVIVAFFPDQAVTVSMAMEERLGSVQDLIAMAMMVQRKLIDVIEPRA
jgi:hypothetical protein